MTQNTSAWLPAPLKEFLQKSGVVLCGLAVAVAAAALTAALVTYHSSDASFNTATTAARVQNALGIGGAYVSDILWQYFGFGGFLFPAALLAWGVLIARGRLNKIRLLRVLFFFPTLISATLFLTCLTIAFQTVVPPEAGGVIAMAVYRPVLQFLTVERYFPHPQLILIPLFFLLTFFGLALTLGIPFEYVKKAAHLLSTAGATVFRAVFKRKQTPFEIVEKDEDELPASILPVQEEMFAPEEIPVAPKKQRIASGKITPKHKGEFELPKLALLNDVKIDKTIQVSRDYLEDRRQKLLEVLKVYRVTGQITGIHPGPVVTLFEFKPTAGIKTARIIGLTDEIAREMRAKSVRMALVPGEDVIGIELPNEKRASVYIKEMFTSDKFKHSEKLLTLALGKDIGGTPTFTDLAKMPHLLVAGTTGSGKSVAINTMILSLLYRLTPEQVRLIMIDPKMLELSIYNDIPHLLTPVVIDPKKAVVALNWAVREMESRYLKMSQMNVRNIEGYNKKVREMAESGDAEMPSKSVIDPETGEMQIVQTETDLKPFPYIVVIVDEMADLMLTAGKDIEIAIQRIAQKARASGIHLIMATQRPSVDVITGTIKANFPERISFRVTTKIDSRTILNEAGAEQLLGMGDMLYSAQGQRPIRLHGPFVSDEEVEKVTDFLRKQRPPEYDDSVTEETEEDAAFSDGEAGGGNSATGDDLYDKAVNIVLTDRKASTSYVQRRLGVGYNKAANLIERMEREGVISAPTPTGKREILVPERR